MERNPYDIEQGIISQDAIVLHSIIVTPQSERQLAGMIDYIGGAGHFVPNYHMFENSVYRLKEAGLISYQNGLFGITDRVMLSELHPEYSYAGERMEIVTNFLKEAIDYGNNSATLSHEPVVEKCVYDKAGKDYSRTIMGVRGISDVHSDSLYYDALTLLAIISTQNVGSPIKKIMAYIDWANRSGPSYEELEGCLSRFVKARLIVSRNGKFRITDIVRSAKFYSQKLSVAKKITRIETFLKRIKDYGKIPALPWRKPLFNKNVFDKAYQNYIKEFWEIANSLLKKKKCRIKNEINS